MQETLNKKNDCCSSVEGGAERKDKKGLLAGIVYGLLPHSFCIAFVVFSVIGATTGALIFKRFLLIPYFFQILVLISFVFATISAIIYLKRNGILSWQGIKRKQRYLTILYGTTILVNLLFFFIVFPAVANVSFGKQVSAAEAGANLTLEVQIPCSGHASLIMGELKKLDGIGNVKFRMPNLFDVSYNPQKTTPEKIAGLEIFKEFKVVVK